MRATVVLPVPGLPVGVAGEHHVVGDRRHLEPLRLALLRHAHELHEPRHLLLHGLETHEAVQLRKGLLHGHRVCGGGRVPHAGQPLFHNGRRVVRRGGSRSAVLDGIRLVRLDRAEHGQQHGPHKHDRSNQPSAPAVQQVKLVEQPPDTPHDNGESERIAQRMPHPLRIHHNDGEADYQYDVQRASDSKIAPESQRLPTLGFIAHVTSPCAGAPARPARRRASPCRSSPVTPPIPPPQRDAARPPRRRCHPAPPAGGCRGR